jgi:hypothetical protein
VTGFCQPRPSPQASSRLTQSSSSFGPSVRQPVWAMAGAGPSVSCSE